MFFDELFPVCFEEIGSVYRTSFLCGQLYYGCCLYSDEHRQVWRPAQYEIAETSARLFAITTAGRDAYNRPIPLHTPALEVNEEFPVIRAKKRPVILFTPVPSPSPTFVAQDHVLHKKVALVAPLYGVLKATGEAKFRQETIDRVRKLEFLHLLYLPPFVGGLAKPSLVRLDTLQPAFLSHLEPLNARLADDVIALLQSMVQGMVTGRTTEEFNYIRSELLRA